MASKLVGERLPPDWSYGVTRDGRIFFIDDRVKATTWLHPVTGQPVQTGHHLGPGLPPGWEQALTPEGAIYFIDHNNRCTTFEHPITGKPVSSDLPPPARTPPQSPSQIKPRKGSTKSRSIKAPTASRSENSRVVMRGWLNKQESGGLKMWKRKWCVVADYGLFIYKDDGEQIEQMSILLPSYKISPCSSSDTARRFAFKAEHENLKTLYFAADSHTDMERWMEVLHMTSLAQKTPGNGIEHQKLIPKPATMTWNDGDIPLTPPGVHQYPFHSPKGPDVSRNSEEFGERSPLQSRENTQDYRSYSQQNTPRDGYGRHPDDDHQNPRSHHSGQGDGRNSQRGSHAYNPSGDYGTLNYEKQQGHSREEGRLPGYPGPGLPSRGYSQEEPRFPGSDRLSSQGQGSPRSDYSQSRNSSRDVYGRDRDRRLSDPRYPVDNTNRSRLPQDQRSQRTYSQSSSGSQLRHPRDGQFPGSKGQYSHSSLPRGSRKDYPDNRSSGGTLTRQPERHSLRDNRPGRPNGDTSFSSLPRNSRLQYPDETSSQSSRQGQGHRYPTRNHKEKERPSSQSPPRSNYDGRDAKPQRSPENPYMLMTPPQNQQITERSYPATKHINRPLPQQPQEPPIHERSRSGGGDYASLQRIRDHIHGQGDGNHDISRSSHDPHSPGSQPSGAVSPPRQRPDLQVDIPHTYVNVYNETQPGDIPPELPSRPPLPASVRHQIVEGIAETATPGTQKDMLTAERNLELRMSQPAFFNYPTPRDNKAPPIPDPPYRDHVDHSQPGGRDGPHNSDQSRYPDARGHSRDSRGFHLADTGVILKSDVGPHDSRVAMETQVTRQPASNSLKPSQRSDSFERDESRDRVAGLSRYQTGEHATLGRPVKDMYSDHYQKYMSDMDVRTRTLPPSKPIKGVTGEKDFRLRSLPDHAQSMPSIFHEQPLSVQVQESQPSVGSYVNLGPPSIASESRLLVKNDNEEPELRKSAFRPLSSDSLQRHPSRESSLQNYPPQSSGPTRDSVTGSVGYTQGYPLTEETNLKHLSSASSQMSSQKRGWPSDRGFQGQNRWDEGRSRDQGRGKGQRAPAIHTVKEDPNMPDSEVIATELPQKVFPLNGPRLRMSISAGDLLGKTHDELVLLLIQLRRDKAELQGQRDQVRRAIEERRPAELQYRKRVHAGLESMDPESELEHRRYLDLKGQYEELDKRLEVYKPLVNLVSNMVTMGSLYGGDNLMLATEYRKHLLSPDQYSPPKKMLEFSRRQQEDRIIKDIENDVKQLTQEEADLEDKLDRLYELDRVIQEQSFQVTSLKEDRELLDKALYGILRQLDENFHPRDKERLLQQQRTIEKELSRVLQQLAQASRELEETTAENNKIEHEVALLRSKVNGDLSRSKSAPSLSSESQRSKMKMEKDLAKVQNIMEGLSKEGARLSEAMNTLRRSSSGGGLMKGLPPLESTSAEVPEPRAAAGGTYFETDIDTNESKDLAQVTALLASYQLAPGQQGDRGPGQELLSFQPLTSQSASQYHSQPRNLSERSTFQPPVSRQEDRTYHASPVHVMTADTNGLSSKDSRLNTYNMAQSGQDMMDSGEPWDIGEADDNTKRFFGLIPKNMPKSQTVRDVKRNAEQRREVKKKEDEPPLRISVISSEYTEPNIPVYENLPQQKSTRPSTNDNANANASAKPWSSVLPDDDTPSTPQRRRSSLHLMAPKPFIPYNNQSNSTSNTPSFAYSSSFTSQPALSSFSAQQSFSQPPDSMMTTFKDEGRHTSSMTNLGRSSDQTDASPVADKPWGSPMQKKSSPVKKFPRGRYLTISSSQPIKLEKNITQSPKLNSSAGDLFSSMDVPDIVKSSTTKIDNFDESTIDREILFFPNKVEIPERYVPDLEEEDLTEEELLQRKERADKIKRILTQQSVHSLSQPDVSQVAGEIHERVQQEKVKREQLLAISQELAEQVKKKTRQFAAERRKTWSGTPGTTSVLETEETYDNRRELNNNLTNGSHYPDSGGDPYRSHKGGNFVDDSYKGNGDMYIRDSPYDNPSYQTTSYPSRQNFRI